MGDEINFSMRMPARLTTLVLVVGLALVSLPPLPSTSAAGLVYYVAKNGSDVNAGSETSPFLTIKKAASVARAGDTVLVKEGVYDEVLTPAGSGAAGSLVTFQAYPNQKVVVTKGVNITTQQYIRIKDFEFTGAVVVAQYATSGGANNEILNNYIHHTPSGGILVNNPSGTGFNLIKGNTLYYTGASAMIVSHGPNVVEDNDISHPQGLGTSTEQDGIQFAGEGRGTVIRNNRIHDIPQVNPTAHVDAFQTWHGRDFIFENNVVYNIAGRIFMLETGSQLPPTENLIIRNNVFYSNANYGVNAKNSVKNVQIINNTFYNTGYDAIRARWSSTNWTIKNNIFYQAGSYYIDDSSKPGLVADYNLTYPNYAGAAIEPHALKGVDPKFVNLAGKDFRLQPGSGAIDAGTSDGAPSTDKETNPRYDDPTISNIGGGTYPYYDIGAYEYNVGGAPALDIAPPVISSVSAGNITANSAQINWLTDEKSDSQVEYGTSTNYGSTTGLDLNGTTNHSQLISNLSPGSTYHFRVKSKDVAGNQAVSDDQIFTTPADTQPGEPEYIWLEAESGNMTSPMETGADSLAAAGKYIYSTASVGGAVDYTFSTTNAGAYVIWGSAIAPNTSRNSFSVSLDSVPEDIWDVLSGELSSNWKWDKVSFRGSGTVDAGQFDPKIFFLTAGTHKLTIKSREANTYLDRILITNDPNYIPTDTVVPEPSDTMPPVISGVSATDVTTSSAQVQWTTDEAAGSEVEYGTDTAYGSTAGYDQNLALSHSQTLTNLEPATTYHYRVKSRDAAGNEALSADHVFTTSALPEYNYIWLEAEDGTLTAPMEKGADADAYGGQYITARLADADGLAEFIVATPEAGDYTIWGRAIAPTTANDSFYAGVDSATEDIWDVLSGQNSSTWKWDRLSLRGAGTFSAPQFDPKIFSLSAGTHKLTIKSREAKTYLDRILITNDPNYVPTDTVRAPADTEAPVTLLTSDPATADGSDGWFKTAPLISLIANEPAVIKYQWDSTAPAGWQTYLAPLIGLEGSHTLYYFATDVANNIESVISVLFNVDTVVPRGTININNSDPATKSTTVTLSPTVLNGPSSGVDKMRFSNDGVFDDTAGMEEWRPYSDSATWTVSAGDGVKTVYAQYASQAGHLSEVVSDTIVLDTVAPSAYMVSKTGRALSTAFWVDWIGVDPEPTAGVKTYDVAIRDGVSGTWLYFLKDTASVSGQMIGLPGHAYYFSVRATDWAGNKGSWSRSIRITVP